MVRLPNYTCPTYGSIKLPKTGEETVIPEFSQSLSIYGCTFPYYLLENTHSLIFVL